MSTATDQLKFRKIIPMKTMMKLTRIVFLAIMTPQIRKGRLMRRLPPDYHLIPCRIGFLVFGFGELTLISIS